MLKDQLQKEEEAKKNPDRKRRVILDRSVANINTVSYPKHIDTEESELRHLVENKVKSPAKRR